MTFAVCFIVGGLAWVIWHFFHLQLTYILSRIRIGELYLDYWLFGDDKTSVTSWGAESVGSWRKYLPKMAIPDISVDVLKRTTVVAVQPLRVVFLAFPVFFAVARIDVAAHFLSDVSASTLIAALLSLIAAAIAARLRIRALGY